MRILITGISGFVGQHLAQHLRAVQPEAELHGTVFKHSGESTKAHCHAIDLRDADAVQALLAHIQPDAIYHLAGQAFVPRSFSHPWETLEINVRAQLNLILACITLQITPRILVVTSAEYYGGEAPQPHVPITEDTPPRPSSPYSVSKVTQDLLALQYHISHQLPIMRARPFNHIGPGQNERFVAPSFALQVARIEAGLQPPQIHVGDLSAQRDFTDVRDIVTAYQLIMQHGIPGEVYNVASGKAHSIQNLLDTLLTYVQQKIEVTVDTERLRPVNIPILLGDSTRLREQIGWQPKYSFEQSLFDVLNDCRQRVRLMLGNTPH